MVWTEEQRLAKKEQMKAYHAKKKAAKEAQLAVEATGGAVTIDGVDFTYVIAPDLALGEVSMGSPTIKVETEKPKNRLPETFKDMPSHLVERLKNQ